MFQALVLSLFILPFALFKKVVLWPGSLRAYTESCKQLRCCIVMN